MGLTHKATVPSSGFDHEQRLSQEHPPSPMAGCPFLEPDLTVALQLARDSTPSTQQRQCAAVAVARTPLARSPLCLSPMWMMGAARVATQRADLQPQEHSQRP